LAAAVPNVLRQDATRDQARMLTVRGYWPTSSAQGERGGESRTRPETGWLIENCGYRLFAQELKTRTVSAKRLSALVQKLAFEVIGCWCPRQPIMDPVSRPSGLNGMSYT